MKDRSEINVEKQVRFGEDGSMEADEEVDTDLTDWDLVEVSQERETRYLQMEASEFGVDDRAEVEQKSQTEQADLFTDPGEDQMTLGGEQAERQSAWGEEDD
jgi:hypothetical protein